MITLEEAQFIVAALDGQIMRGLTNAALSPGIISARDNILHRFRELYESDTNSWSDALARQARGEWLYQYLGGKL